MGDSYPGVIICEACGRIYRGEIYEDGRIIPKGVAECVDCGGDDWAEVVDTFGRPLSDDDAEG